MRRCFSIPLRECLACRPPPCFRRLRHLPPHSYLIDTCRRSLLWAVRNGNVTAVKLLIARGADVNATCTPKRSCALMSACFEGFDGLARLLLNAGAHVNQSNEQGYTPLIVAAMQGRESCVELLLDSGAEVDQHMTTEGAATALLAAAQQGHVRCVSMLLAAGGRVNQANENGDVPLGAAAYKGQVACAERILLAGASVDHANARGATPLGLACYGGHAKCAALMLSHGASIDHAADGGRTCMYAASRLGHVECVQILSSFGARRSDIGAVGNVGAEETCEAFGHAGLAEWLRLSRGWTPLHHIEQLTVERATELLRAGADVHAASAAGGPTPVARAAALQPQTDVSAIVQRAALPWSTHEHQLFPRPARARAVALLMIGHRLASEPRFNGESHSLLDAWRHVVMSFAVTRDSA